MIAFVCRDCEARFASLAAFCRHRQAAHGKDR